MRDSRMGIGTGDQPELLKTGDGGDDHQRLVTEAHRLDALALPGLVEPIHFDPGPPAVLGLRWVGSHTLATARPGGTEAIAGLVAELADTVAALHDRGVGHTALTAEHVLIDGEGHPVLAGTGNLTELEPGQAADEVAALGALLADLVGDTTEIEPIPDRRGRRHRWTGFARRALATLADQAAADEVDIRPTAAGFAQSLRTAVGAERPPLRPAPSPSRSPAGPAPQARHDEHHDPTPGPAAPHAVGLTGDTKGAGATDPLAPVPDPLAPDRLAPDPLVPATAGDDPVEPPADDAGVGGVGGGGGRSGGAVPAPLGGPEPTSTPGPGGSPARAALLGSLAASSAAGPAERLRRVLEGRAGRLAALAAVIVGTALLLVGLITFTSGGPRPRLEAAGPGAAGQGLDHGRPSNGPSTVTTPPTSAGAPSASAPDETAEPAPSTAPSQASGRCPRRTAPESTGPGTPSGVAAADIDGDGCREPVRVEAGRVTAGDVSYQVGEPGDRAAVADWTCDGTATPALVRPATGEVFVFDGWATPGSEVSVAALARVADAQHPSARDADDDGCPELVVARDGAPGAVIAVGTGP